MVTSSALGVVRQGYENGCLTSSSRTTAAARSAVHNQRTVESDL